MSDGPEASGGKPNITIPSHSVIAVPDPEPCARMNAQDLAIIKEGSGIDRRIGRRDFYAGICATSFAGAIGIWGSTTLSVLVGEVERVNWRALGCILLFLAIGFGTGFAAVVYWRLAKEDGERESYRQVIRRLERDTGSPLN